MDGYYTQLVQEVNDKLDRLAEACEPWVANWVAEDICKDHDAALPKVDGSEFWRWGAYQHIRETVRKQINKRAGATAELRAQKQQLVFEGFQRIHLQDYYMVERDGDELGIPLLDLTDPEIDAKAAHYRAMGKGCDEHADELLRFKEWRNGGTPAEVAS